MAQPSDALAQVLEVLDRLEIQYEIGGSVASSYYGLPRMTQDVDLVAELKPDHVSEFVYLLQRQFYADEAQIREALRRERAFNLIHFATAYKFDVFPLRADPYSRQEFGRRRMIRIRPFGTDELECAVATAEDTILRKLEWYRAGGESSERQWGDLRGVVAVQGERLDREYLRLWAKELRVADLLERLLG